MRVWLTSLVPVGLALAPRLAEACSVCSPGTDENRTAFLITTAFMTALPLVMIGSVVTWFWRRVAFLRREEEALDATRPIQE